MKSPAVLARKWRENQSDSRAYSGVVLVWSGAVYGWKDCLRDAAHERPDAMAVDCDGNVFRAAGGDDYNGSKCWVAVSH